MKGFVPTPDYVVDLMVEKLFAERPPKASSCVLDPGCGNGEFIAGIIRLCEARNWPLPAIVGVELNSERAATASRRFSGVDQVTIRNADFLSPSPEAFDFIIGNPPYVSILELSEAERRSYRTAYRTAVGRFDLYVLFFEQALKLLVQGGRVVFITPEKFLYVESARELRELFCDFHVAELHFTGEDTFENRVVYPLITTIDHSREAGPTRIVRRNGSVADVSVGVSSTWMPIVEGFIAGAPGITLADVATRISCGIATGADSVFLMPTNQVPVELKEFAHPTISGRQIAPDGRMERQSSLLVPYDKSGRLLSESKLGALGRFLREPHRSEQLRARTCVSRKPWYAYHDSFPINEMGRPKLLCKDITESPFFVIDHEGTIVPRHSVYYVVPKNSEDVEALAEYLNSSIVTSWLRAHCQRAAGGFLRLQSHTLKRIPVPNSLAVASVTLKNIELELQLA